MFADGHLPVFSTAIASFRFVLTHRRELLRIASLAVPALLIVAFGADSFESRGIIGWDAAGEAVRSLIGLAVHAVIASIVLVAWHRVVLLKRTGEAPGPALAFGWREIRYLSVWLALSAGFLGVFAAVVAVIAALQFLTMLALYIGLSVIGLADTLVIGQRDQFVILLWIAVFFAVPAASYVTGRLTLVLPALAVDRRRPLRQAWRMSAGNGWRLVAASLIVLVPMESIAALCSAAAARAYGTLAYAPLVAAAAVSLFLLIVLTGTILSFFSIKLDTAAPLANPYGAEIAIAE